MILARLFQHNPNRPRIFTSRQLGPLIASRDDLISYTQPDKMSQLTSIDAQMLEAHALLMSDLDDSVNVDRCPSTEVSKHLFRVLPCIYRCMVSGTGEFSMPWSNPSLMLPLRVRAFSSLLHLLTSMKKLFTANPIPVHSFTESTSTLLENILCLLFDEQSIFLGADTMQLENVSRQLFDHELQSPITSDRTNSLVYAEDPASEHNSTFSAKTIKSSDTHSCHSDERTTQEKPEIDTKFDFQAALKSSVQEEDDTITVKRDSGLQVTGGSSTTRRRWISPSSSLLATIKEDGDRCEIDDEFGGGESESFRENELMLRDRMGLTDSNNLREFKIGTGVKQMRVPNITFTGENYDHPNPSIVERRLPPDDKDIEAAGNSFLDSLG
jgi:hypothetical protein